MVDVGRERQFAARFGDDVAGKTFPIQHGSGVELVFRAERAGLRENMAGARIFFLNFCQRAVFAENRQSMKENVIVRARRPIGEIVADEIRAEEVASPHPLHRLAMLQKDRAWLVRGMRARAQNLFSADLCCRCRP